MPHKLEFIADGENDERRYSAYLNGDILKEQAMSPTAGVMVDIPIMKMPYSELVSALSQLPDAVYEEGKPLIETTNFTDGEKEAIDNLVKVLSKGAQARMTLERIKEVCGSIDLG